MSAATNSIFGVLLAGGQSRRMDRPDKFFLQWRGQTLLQHTIARAAPQVQGLVITAAGDLDRFAACRLPAIHDRGEPGTGPLAGIISAMAWLCDGGRPVRWLASFPTDTPRIPLDLVEQLHCAAREAGADVAYARSHNRDHYACALWSVDCYPTLLELHRSGVRSLHKAAHTLTHTTVLWEGDEDPFFNVNTPRDWENLRPEVP